MTCTQTLHNICNNNYKNFMAIVTTLQKHYIYIFFVLCNGVSDCISIFTFQNNNIIDFETLCFPIHDNVK